MGTVYICEVREGRSAFPWNAEHVVWKSYHIDEFWSTDGASIRELFEREAMLWLNLLPHPNIIKASTVERLDRRIAINLEYADGGDLRARLLQNSLSLLESLQLACQFCDGMDFLHRTANILHLDIKPENILLTKTNRLKISDFGLAKIFGPATKEDVLKLTQDGSPPPQSKKLLGTMPYMAPELWSDPDAASERSDLFSFGVVFYEMLTGRRPFHGRTIAELRDQILQREPEPLSGSDAYPRELDSLVRICLSKRVADRLQSFAALRHEIEKIGETLSVADQLPRSVSIQEIEDGMTGADWTGRGYGMARLGNWEESLRCYEHAHAHALAPELLVSIVNLGTAVMRVGKHEEALAHFKRAVSIADAGDDPEDIFLTYRGLASCYSRMQRLDETWQALESAIKAKSDNLATLREFAALSLHLEKMEACQQTLKTLETLLRSTVETNQPLYFCNEGIQLERLGSSELAKIFFELAVEYFPDSALACYNLAVCRHRHRDVKSALVLYDAALRLKPEILTALVNRGVLRARQGDWPSALTDWQTALALNPEHQAAKMARSFIMLSRVIGQQPAAMPGADALAIYDLF